MSLSLRTLRPLHHLPRPCYPLATITPSRSTPSAPPPRRSTPPPRPVHHAARLLASQRSSSSFPHHPVKSPRRPSSTPPTPGRAYSSSTAASPSSPSELQPPDYLSPTELDIFKKLQAELSPTRLEVQDISGGCGSMFGLDIVSERFAGLSVIKQHQLVNRVLREEIKGWHGMQLKTKAG